MFSKQLQVGFLASARLGKGCSDILHDRATSKNKRQKLKFTVTCKVDYMYITQLKLQK